MPSHFARSIAIRHLRFNPGQTLLCMGVVAVSVTLIVFLSSLIGGVQARLINSVTGAIPHVVVKQPQRLPIAAWEVAGAGDAPALGPAGDAAPAAPATRPAAPAAPLYVGERIKLEQRKRKIEDWALWLDRLGSFDPRVTAVSPVVEGQGFISRGAQRRGVSVTGVIPERHNRVVDIQSKLTKGRFFGLNAGEAAIGYLVADELSLRMGDKVRLLSAEGNAGTYTVAGVFETGFFQVDNGVFVPLRDGQTLFGLGTAVTSIGVKLDDIYAANDVADDLQRQVPYQTSSWMRDYQALLTGLRAQSATSNMILLFTVLGSGFAIASIMIMSVVSKTREIGILKAMGATRRQVLGVFTLEGVLLAFLGALVGTALGCGLALGFSRIEVNVGASAKPVQMFPVGLGPGIIFMAITVALIVGFLAALYPAWRAGRVNPIEVIRGL